MIFMKLLLSVTALCLDDLIIYLECLVLKTKKEVNAVMQQAWKFLRCIDKKKYEMLNYFLSKFWVVNMQFANR